MLNIRNVLVSLAVAFIFMLTVREAIAAGATIPSTNAANQSAIKRRDHGLFQFAIPLFTSH